MLYLQTVFRTRINPFIQDVQYLINPSPEKHLRIWIRHAICRNPHIRGPHTVVLKLHIIIHYQVCKHQLELACCEVSPRTGVSPMAESERLGASGRHVESPSTRVLFFEFDEPEGVEIECVRVDRFIRVDGVCGDHESCSARNSGAVGEGVVLTSGLLHED